MQLTSKRHSMVVEFRPHAILTDKFVYTLKFKGETQSMRLFNKKEMIEACNSRLDIHGYEVTDFLTEPQQYMPASCWFMSLIKHYLHQIMTETQDNIIDRDQLQEDMINRIIDGMDIDGLCQLAYDYLNESYDKYSVDELIAEVEEYYPDMMEDWTEGGSPKASP